MRRVPITPDERNVLYARDSKCLMCRVELDGVGPVAISHVAPTSRGLDKALREYRTKQCGNDPAYTVMTNRSIDEIVSSLPDSIEKLLAIHGLGKAKVEKYGAGILQIVSEHKAGSRVELDLKDIYLLCAECNRRESRRVQVPKGVLNVLNENGISLGEAVRRGLSKVIRELEE